MAHTSLSTAMAHTSLSTATDSSPPLYTYIVYVRRPPANLLSSDADSLQKYYLSFIPKSGLDSSMSSRLIYSYECMRSFAARLTEEEASAMSSIPGFVLRPKAGLWRQSNQGKDVISGMLDTIHSQQHHHALKIKGRIKREMIRR